MVPRLLALVFAIAVSLFADTGLPQPVRIETTDHVKFAPGGTIHIEKSSGEVTVTGWDQPEVEVTVVRSLGYLSQPEAEEKRRLDSVQVTTERKSDAEVTIATKTPPPGFLGHLHLKGTGVTVEYRIRVPRNSNLVIHHDGYVAVTNVTGNINATDRRGDIVLMLPDLAAYSVDAHARLGVVSSDKPAASAGASPQHTLKLRMRFGGITIKELPKEALVDTTAVKP
jgi:hypothetical protein